VSEIHCMPLKKVTDGPLFAAGPGTLSSLVNMDLQPDGYAEARGGMEELKPLGGTPADAISAGGYSDAHQISTSLGWVRTFDEAAAAGSEYSANLILSPGNVKPFATGVVDDAIYFGADLPFSRVFVDLIIDASWTVTLVREYWNGATWAALTTAENIQWVGFALTRQFESWTMPTDWVANTIGDSGTGNVLKYWMRIRISVSTLITTLPRVNAVGGSWVGMRELYVCTQSPRTSGTAGTFKRHGQTGTTEEWFAINSSLFSGNASPSRLASYRGRVLFVNGKEQKHWDGYSLRDIGLAKPGTGATATAVAAGAVGMGDRVTRVYIAFGYGPTALATTEPNDSDPLYGWSEATYISEVTTMGAQDIRIDWSGLTIGSNVSCLGIYFTQDLTSVTAAERANFPAFLWDTEWRQELIDFTTTQMPGVTGPVLPLFPQQEAFLYDNKPPSRCKYIAVHQNRLLLGDDDYWYWSDAFKPDIFNRTQNFMALARAQGGRHMGGIGFGDQAVLFTEDQTWGLSNIDLDVPRLFEIHPGVGCVAPDSIAMGDGLLVWLARDGVYAWDGSPNAPVKVSTDFEQTFGKMSYESHGGSKATVHERRYDVTLSSPDYGTTLGSFRLNFETMKWSTLTHAGFTSTLFPLATIHAPLGNNDAGKQHPLWGKADYLTSGVDYSLYLGELTTQDNGTNYICSATMHFPLPPNSTLTPSKLLAYYQAADGWGTPTLANAVATPIGSTPGTLTADTPNTGTDYSLLHGTYSGVGATSDIQVTFSVSSAASGTVNRQRLFGAVLKGKAGPMRRQFV
jgi:hypothetical protein